MTNEEKAKEIAKKNEMVFYVVGNSYNECYKSAMQMAEWKDGKIAFALSFLKPKLSANEYAIVCDRLNFKE